METVHKVVLLIYGYKDENARSESWNPYDDPHFVSAETELLEARLQQWNQDIVERRVKELKLAIQESEKAIANINARESAVGKLSAEDKAVLRIGEENFDAQRTRRHQDTEHYEMLISKLTSLSLTEIMKVGLVGYWWAFEPAEIKPLEDFVATMSDIDL